MQNPVRGNHPLLQVDHLGVHVSDVRQPLGWYRRSFGIDVRYQEAYRALLHFNDVSLALVAQTPPAAGRTAGTPGETNHVNGRRHPGRYRT